VGVSKQYQHGHTPEFTFCCLKRKVVANWQLNAQNYKQNRGYVNSIPNFPDPAAFLDLSLTNIINSQRFHDLDVTFFCRDQSLKRYSESKSLLWDWSIKPNHCNFRLSKCKQNKRIVNDVVAQGGIISATDSTLNFYSAFASEMGRLIWNVV